MLKKNKAIFNILTEDKFFDECGVFGIYSNDHDVGRASFLALHALQHRGQESAGIAVSQNKSFNCHKGMGLVQQVFSEKIINSLQGNKSIGHVRYSTSGSSVIKNAQPLVVKCNKGTIAIAHNGNLVNAKKLRKELEKEGSIFQSEIDSEVIIHLIARSKKENIREALIEVLKKIEGAYSLLVMTENEIIGVRDPLGFRPLCIGMIKNSYCIASETCALEQVGAEYLRDVNPSEMVIIKEKNLYSYSIDQNSKLSMCVFELIYLSRPDSTIFGYNVYSIRKTFGRILAREYSIDADLVIPVPDSGIPAALGYSEESGIPYDMGLLRNHYMGRTFIQPDSGFRGTKVRIKLSPIPELISGKKIIVVDDSIVRGTTSKEIVKMLRYHGAKEIHYLSSSPPITYPCFYGIDTPDKKELIASIFNNDIARIKNYLKVDSIFYLSMNGLFNLLEKDEKEQFCKACFNGKYPIIPTDYQALLEKID